jgi:hypothetical protein
LSLGAIAFFPVAACIIEGQDMVLLLLLFVLAVTSLDLGNDARAGAFLAAGLFRPQLAVPLVVLFAVRRWRILVGFAPVALVLGGISVAIMGWRGPLDYVRFVFRLEGTPATRAFGPEAVPNLRGLIAELPGLNALGPWTGLLILAASLGVFVVALRRIHNEPGSIVYSSSLAAVTTILVSFHALVYDLSLLLPMALFLLSQIIEGEDKKINTWTAVLAVLLLLSPIYMFLWLAVERFFWFSLILIWLYLRLILAPAPAEVPA